MVFERRYLMLKYLQDNGVSIFGMNGLMRMGIWELYMDIFGETLGGKYDNIAQPRPVFRRWVQTH